MCSDEVQYCAANVIYRLREYNSNSKNDDVSDEAIPWLDVLTPATWTHFCLKTGSVLLFVLCLIQLVSRPDVVEMHDVTAQDPKLLVHLKVRSRC